MIVFRHADHRFPFLWESGGQPAARWHAEGEGPVHYFADTPDGAWAELLRHEEIREEEDLAGIHRLLWAVEVLEVKEDAHPELDERILTGGPESYPACRQEAARLRRKGVEGFWTKTAALQPGGASGWIVDGGLQPAGKREGQVLVLFGPRPDLVGWKTSGPSSPPDHLLGQVRHF